MLMFYLDMVDATTGAPVAVTASIALANSTFSNEMTAGSADALTWWYFNVTSGLWDSWAASSGGRQLVTAADSGTVAAQKAGYWNSGACGSQRCTLGRRLGGGGGASVPVRDPPARTYRAFKRTRADRAIKTACLIVTVVDPFGNICPGATVR